MKRIKIIIIVLAVFIHATSQVSAYNYTFSSGADSSAVFDKPTTLNDDFTVTNPNENMRNNKDMAYTPPPYGTFSGNIDTDFLSPYHTPEYPSTVHSTPSISITYSDYTSSHNSTTTPAPNTQVSNGEILPSTSLITEEIRILPLYYDDGSIGVLEFPDFSRTIKVYEGETLDNMRLGAGHASSTSSWDGNCAIFGHNRGVTNNFNFLKDMNVGDKVIYSTKYGVRYYEVVSKVQIADNDMSPLTWSNDNLLSLVTCVENVENMRIFVMCREIR
jgi:sortase A